MVQHFPSLAVPLDDAVDDDDDDESTSIHCSKREMDIILSSGEDDTDLMMLAKKTFPHDVPMPMIA